MRLGLQPTKNPALDEAQRRIETAFAKLGDVERKALLSRIAHHPAEARQILSQTLGFAVPDDLALPWSSDNVVAIANDVLRVKAPPGGADGCHQALLRNVGPAFDKVASTIVSMLDGGAIPPPPNVQVELRKQFTRMTALADVMPKRDAADANQRIRQTFDTLAAAGVQGFSPAERTLERKMFGRSIDPKVSMTADARTLALYVDAMSLGDDDARMVDPVRGQPIAPTGHDDTKHLGNEAQPFGFLHPPNDPRFVLVPTKTTIGTKPDNEGSGFNTQIDGIQAALPISFDVGDGEARLVDGKYEIDMGEGHAVELDVRDLTLTYHTPDGTQHGSIAEGFEQAGRFVLTTPNGRQLALQRVQQDGQETTILAVQRPDGAFAAVDFAAGVVFDQRGNERTVVDRP